MEPSLNLPNTKYKYIGYTICYKLQLNKIINNVLIIIVYLYNISTTAKQPFEFTFSAVHSCSVRRNVTLCNTMLYSSLNIEKLLDTGWLQTPSAAYVMMHWSTAATRLSRLKLRRPLVPPLSMHSGGRMS